MNTAHGGGLEGKSRLLVISAALLALFMGAMDSLIMSAAMPTIVAELGRLDLYSWVYSTYFLSRAISLPIFGKLADLVNNRRLFIFSISLFVVSSIAAGLSPNMTVLIISRVFQGLGAGGNFALVYIVLADVSAPQDRAKTMSFASSIWGIASVLGPTLGGFIVTYFSWRWIFFINIPLGLFSLAGIAFFLVEIRDKKKSVQLDLYGVITLSISVTGLLTIFMVGGRKMAWLSPAMIGLWSVTVLSAIGFYFAEKRAADPMLPLQFFTNRGFSSGNGAVFLCSFSIFALFAYAPLFIQGALGKSPMEVGIGMLSLSLGWSLGSLMLGQMSKKIDIKHAAVAGSLLLISGCAATLFFTAATTMTTCFIVFFVVGLGMGFVTLATLVVVQNAVDIADLGVATSSNQFARTLGGTVGVGICGGFMMSSLARALDALERTGAGLDLPADVASELHKNFDSMLRPEFYDQLTQGAQEALKTAIAQSIGIVFWIILLSALLCFVLCMAIPKKHET